MQSSRVIKISSRQSAPITSTANLLDYELPPGKFDLSRSYLQIESNMDSGPGDLAQYVGRYPGQPADASIYDNISLVRHGSLRSITKGVIETSRHVNVLRNNLKSFTDSQGKQLSELYVGKFQGTHDRNGLMASQWRELSKTGTAASTNKSHEHIVPLSDIFNFAKHDYYDTSRHGDLTINLEMAPESMVPYPILTGADSYLGAAYWTNIEAPNTVANGAIVLPNPAPPTGTDYPQPVSMQRRYNSIGNSPFFVGQLVRLTATQFIIPVDTSITKITYDEITRSIQLTFADAIAVDGGTATDLSIATRAPTAAPTVAFPKADLVLVEVDEVASPPDEYQYTTYKLQEDTQAATNLNKNYMIGPLCKNVLLCMPAALGADTPRDLLNKKKVSSYRFSVNNKFLQNRLIPIQSGQDHITGLHQTQIMKSFDNMDADRKGSGYFLEADNSLAASYKDAQVNYTLMTPVPLTGSQKMFGVEINMDAALTVDQLFIFEETLAMLK
jgi:hypothetical protein